MLEIVIIYRKMVDYGVPQFSTCITLHLVTDTIYVFYKMINVIFTVHY